MKKYLISFATPNFYKGQRRLNRSALKHGIDECISCNLRNLKKTAFYWENKSILDQKRGAGYWLWKPYYILDTFDKVQEGDVVIYSDSGLEIIDDLQPLIDICLSGADLMVFQVHDQESKGETKHLNRRWTKRDCFVLMGADTEEYHNSGQVAGTYQVYLKNERNMAFVEEWLSYCKDARILTDKPNTCGLDNLPEFFDHRHDQSILSILAKRHNIEVFRDPSQFGEHLKVDSLLTNGNPGEYIERAGEEYKNSSYGTLFNLHRERNFSITYGLAYATAKATGKAHMREASLDDISIGITTFEDRFDDYFVPLLSRIRELDSNTEVIVVINGEHNKPFGEDYRKRILEVLSRYENVYPVVFPTFRGVSKLWNTIVIHASYDHILILNDDIMIENPDALDKVKVNLRRNEGRSFTINNSWSHFVVSRKEIDELGYFDERLLGIGEEDGDFVWRYIREYGRSIENFKMKQFMNYSNRTEQYRPDNIICMEDTKYSVFNREFMFNQKYVKDSNGVKGMFDDAVSIRDEGPKQYPNEEFFRTRKREL